MTANLRFVETIFLKDSIVFSVNDYLGSNRVRNFFGWDDRWNFPLKNFIIFKSDWNNRSNGRISQNHLNRYFQLTFCPFSHTLDPKKIYLIKHLKNYKFPCLDIEFFFWIDALVFELWFFMLLIFIVKPKKENFDLGEKKI